MLNQVNLTGYIMEIKGCIIVLAIRKSYKETKNIKDITNISKFYDYIPINFDENIYKNLHILDLIGIKGKLEAKKNNIIIKAEKITTI